MRRFYVVLLSVIMIILSARNVSAQQPTPSDDDVNAIARQLYCPVCENTPLDVCPTQACHDWRELIRQLLIEGKTPDQIKQYFVDHYGARVLSKPPAVGFNWLAYIVPPIVFLAGVYLLFQAFRIWKSQKAVNPSTGEKNSESSSNDDYVALLEQELQKRK
jgi:cytochrome c-type biogenesis protein CcmH